VDRGSIHTGDRIASRPAGAVPAEGGVLDVLAIYIGALIIGGVLVAASMFLGGKDAEADHGGHDHDVDHGHDHGHGDHDHDHDDGAFGDAASWLPLASLRFWTFFLAFGGLAGTALTLLSTGAIVTAIVAVVTGYVSGVAVTQVLRRLRRNEVSSEVGVDDCVGSLGKLTLPVSKNTPGKVRVRIKDRDLDLMATTDDDGELPTNAEVLVYEMRDDGVALVTASHSKERGR
jgi:membrane protein implicated in regulation of membrane protease activity